MRFKLRFSLLKFLVLFTVVACAVGLVGSRYFEAKNQKTAVSMLLNEKKVNPQKAMNAAMKATLLKQFGAKIQFVEDEASVEIFYDFDIGSKDIEFMIEQAESSSSNRLGEQIQLPRPRKKSRFIDWFGVDFCHDAVRAEFNRSVNDEDVGYLRMMSGLKELKIEAHQSVEPTRKVADLDGLYALEFLELTNCEIPAISRMPSLQKLEVWHKGMPNRNLVLPKNLKEFELFLDLRGENQDGFKEDLFPVVPGTEKLSVTFDSDSQASFRALEFVHQFPNLRGLTICGSVELDSAGIAKLGTLTQLEEISLGVRSGDLFFRQFQELTPLAVLLTNPKSERGDQGIDWKPLSKLKKLKRIHLDFDELSDEALKHLCSGATELTSLSMSSQSVGDEGLDYIDGLQKLKVLTLGDTRVSRRRLKQFQRSNEGCEVKRISWN